MNNKSEWSKILFTENLKIVAATVGHVRAELESPECLAEMLEAVVQDGWPPGEYDRDAQEFFRDALLAGGGMLVGWLCWYAMRRMDGKGKDVLIGAGGFTGVPDERGNVEIGFSIMPQWRGQGLCSEMVKALAGNAFANPCTSRISARTKDGNLAARRVLEKAGFSLTGSGMDDIVLYEINR